MIYSQICYYQFLENEVLLLGLVIGSKHIYIQSVLNREVQCLSGQSVLDDISSSYCYKIPPFLPNVWYHSGHQCFQTNCCVRLHGAKALPRSAVNLIRPMVVTNQKTTTITTSLSTGMFRLSQSHYLRLLTFCAGENLVLQQQKLK